MPPWKLPTLLPSARHGLPVLNCRDELTRSSNREGEGKEKGERRKKEKGREKREEGKGWEVEAGRLLVHLLVKGLYSLSETSRQAVIDEGVP